MGKKIFVFIISVMMTVCYVSAQKIEAPQIIITNDSVASGETVQIPVFLNNNADAFCAFQFSLLLPDGISPVVGSDGMLAVTGGELISDHEFSCNYVDNTLYVGCVSMTNSVFLAESGVICYITLAADSVNESVTNQMWVSNVEFCTPAVERFTATDCRFLLTVLVNVVPDFSLDILPFSISGSIETDIVIESSVDISSIAFDLTIPELFAQRKLITLLSRLIATNYNTEIVQIDDYTYSIKIESILDSVIFSGSTRIAGISVDKAILFVPADVYLFNLENIVITTSDGIVYNLAPVEYKVDLTSTAVESIIQEPAAESVTYYSLDGRRISSPGKGVTLVRHADGRVTKIINR